MAVEDRAQKLTRAMLALPGATIVQVCYVAWHFRHPTDQPQWYTSHIDDLIDGYDAMALLKRPRTTRMAPNWMPMT
jgi:hypothetical protein